MLRALAALPARAGKREAGFGQHGLGLLLKRRARDTKRPQVVAKHLAPAAARHRFMTAVRGRRPPRVNEGGGHARTGRAVVRGELQVVAEAAHQGQAKAEAGTVEPWKQCAARVRSWAAFFMNRTRARRPRIEATN